MKRKIKTLTLYNALTLARPLVRINCAGQVIGPHSLYNIELYEEQDGTLYVEHEGPTTSTQGSYLADTRATAKARIAEIAVYLLNGDDSPYIGCVLHEILRDDPEATLYDAVKATLTKAHELEQAA